MSWDADLSCPTCGCNNGHDWNYTSNCNPMIYAVIKDAGLTIGGPWWAHLNGMSGKYGAEFLTTIITGLEADPIRFRAMDPPNGWGDFDSLLRVLREMRDASADRPTFTWEASG